MSSDAVASLRTAILTLHGGHLSSQHSANQWLAEFATTDYAWTACFQLINPHEPSEVSFFCANVLHNKVKTQWSKLTPDQRKEFPELISTKLDELTSDTGNAHQAAQRLCLVLAIVAVFSGPDVSRQFVSRALTLASGAGGRGKVFLDRALLLLTSFAEQIGDLEGQRRERLVTAVALFFDDVANLVQSVTTGQLTLAGDSVLPLVPALTCLDAWLKLDPGGAGLRCRSPGELLASHGLLFRSLLSMLGTSSLLIADKASETLSELLAPGRCAPSGTHGDRDALLLAVQALGALRPRLEAPQGDLLACPVGRIAASIVQRDSELGAGPGVTAETLAGAMLACAAQPGRAAMEATLDYFMHVNTVPLQQRHPSLGELLYSQVAMHCLRHAQYPLDFTNWQEEVEEEEEAFYSFREQGMQDLLDECVYPLTRVSYLSLVASAVRGARQWQVLEAALYGLHAVHLSLKREHAGPQAREVDAALHSLFSHLTSEGSNVAAHLNNTWLCRTLAQVVSDYAFWLGTNPAAPLEPCMRLLLHILAQPVACRHAATAFRSACVRAAARLGPALVPLAAAAYALVAPPLLTEATTPVAMHLDAEDRQAVVEGLARVAGALPREQMAQAAIQLVEPLMQRIQVLVGSGPDCMWSSQRLGAVAEEVQLVGVVMRYLDLAGAADMALAHPALRVLEHCWPLLSALMASPACQQRGAVLDAVCEVYTRALTAAKSASKGILGPLLSSMVDVFTRSGSASCLDVLGTATELFGSLSSHAPTAELQRTVLNGALDAAARYMEREGGDVTAHGELLRGLLVLADRHFVFSRQALLESPHLPSLLSWAVSAAAVREREPAASALALLGHLLGAVDRLKASPDGAAQGGVLEACVWREGLSLTRVLLRGAADTCPRALLRPLAAVMYTLQQSSTFGEAAAHWLRVEAQATDFPGVSSGLLLPEDLQHFVELALRRPALARARFDALLSDFARLPRGEGTSDMLLAYEL